jgi:RNA polymerase sigma factor (sigma-70 family)
MASLTQIDVEKLYSQMSERIYRFFYYKFLAEEVAEDLTSKTFLRFIKKVRADEPIREPDKFIFGMAKVIYLEALRDKYALPTTQLEDYHQLISANDVEEFVEEVDKRQTLEELASPYISRLPEKQRDVVYRRLIQKKSVEEVCRDLGVSPRYVRTTQNRGFNRLRELIACVPPNTSTLNISLSK